MGYHFIGIKGSGMSALACILHDLGYYVQGSDKTYYLFSEEALKERKIKMLPFGANNITKGLTVVIGNAFRDDHEEVVKARELGVKMVRYFELLGALTREYQTVAVSGCHGKTTTTALLSWVFNELVGANYLIGDGTGFAQPGNKYFMIEACEYKRHFLYYYPQYTIMTNIDLDHMDYFKDLNDMKDAYLEFGNQTKDLIIANGDDEHLRSLKFKTKVLYYGVGNNNDFVAKNIEFGVEGSKFDVYYQGKILGHFALPLYGEHMVLNALSVIALAYLKGLALNQVEALVKSFKGARRRFVEKKVKDYILIDDYAHHPREMEVTIKAVRQKYPGKKVVAIYLPNTYSRMKALHEEMGVSLNLADVAYVMPIKCDREKETEWPGVSASLLLKHLKRGELITLETVDKLLKHHDSVIIFMSCSEIYHLQAKFEALLKS